MLNYKDAYIMLKTAQQLKAPAAAVTATSRHTDSKNNIWRTLFGSGDLNEALSIKGSEYDPYSIVQHAFGKAPPPAIAKGTYKVTSNSLWSRKKRIALMSAALAARRKSRFFGSRYPMESIPSIDEDFISSPIK